MKNKIFKIFNKGFTLIELLAVIVVLAVILAVAVPRIMSVIEESEKEALKLSAKNIEKAARDRLHMNTDYPKEDINYLIIDGEFVGDSIPLSGNLPETGMILVKSNGDVGLALTNGKFCLIKNPEEDEMTITNDLDDCSFITETPSTCFFYEEESDTEIVITSYKRYECPLDVVIPETINGMTVIGIGAGAFDNRQSGGNENVQKNKASGNIVAYNGQVGLNNGKLIAYNYGERDYGPKRSVILPDTIKFIGNFAFAYNLLKNIKLPNNVEYIGAGAFLYNEIKSINIPSSVKEIGAGAFNGNQLPDDQAFIYYRNPDGSIDNSILISYGGSRKDNITIPSNVRIIEEVAFADSRINSITIHSNTETIKDNAFLYNDLKSINIPNNIEIKENAISYTFDYSFNDYYNELSGTYSAACQNCTWKHSTQSAPPIPTSCFEYDNYEGPNQIRIRSYNYDCPKDVVIPSKIEEKNVVNIASDSFMGMNLISVIFPNTIRTIGYSSFSYNQLTSVTIPSNIEYIGIGAFSDNNISNLTLNNGIEEIDDHAFSYNKLVNLTLPNSVTYVGIRAFHHNRLSNLTIGTGLEELSLAVFSENLLTNVTIPNTLKKIGPISFQSNKLTSINIPSTVIEIGGGAFSDNLLPDGMAFIYKRNSDGSIDNSQLMSYGGSKKANVTIPNNVKIISQFAFNNCNLENVTIPNGVTSIEDSSFDFNNLTNLIIPNSVTSIGDYAFRYNMIVSLIIPNSVISIGNGAFGENKLTSLIIPNSVTSVGTSAFSWNHLTNLTLSENLTELSDSAFSANSLTSIVIPNSVTKIGDSTFAWNNLTRIVIPANVEIDTDSISLSFYNAYRSKKLAGTYTAESQNNIWTKQP